MESYMLLFPNQGHVKFLQFHSELRALSEGQNDWEIEAPIERRGFQNIADHLKIFGKSKKARRKLIVKIVAAMVASSLSYVLFTAEPGKPLLEIRIENTRVIIIESGTNKRLDLDSTKLESEIDKLDTIWP